LLAPAVVVPLGLQVIPMHGKMATSLMRATRTVQPAGALMALVSFLVPTGWAAGLVAAGWLAVCTIAALAGLSELLETRSVLAAAALGFLAGGAAWLVAYRSGIYAGFGPTIAELTAVHLHYAGFGATVMSALAYARLRSRLSGLAGLLVVAGTPVTAAGFALGNSALYVVGPSLLAVGLLTNAALTAFLIAPHTPRAARWLLTISAATVVVPMLLGLDYALARVFPIPALDLRTMAIVHGDLNAFAYALVGLAGWNRA
jgi:YndJ-like protein